MNTQAGERWLHPRRSLLSSLILLAVLTPFGQGCAQTPGHLESLPTNPDRSLQYVFYLHGRIIETSGRRPTHPQFGVYEYDQVLDALGGSGVQVISEHRPADTEVNAYARKVADDVRALIGVGVSASQITVAGFSKGGLIAIATSSILDQPVNYVFLAACSPVVLDGDLAVSGRILSVFEETDAIGVSCRPLLERSPDVTEWDEVRISTGARHGAFYEPRDVWVEPLRQWIEEGTIQSSAPDAATVDAESPAPLFERHQPDVFSTFGAQPNAWADIDGDRDLDLFVGFRGQDNRLYRNDDGTFFDVGPAVGLSAQAAAEAETRAAAWGDYDGDGDLDLYVGYVVGSRTPVQDRLYRNDEAGTRFVNVTDEVGLDVVGATRQPAFVDYDGDGDVDLFVSLRDQPNRLYRNDGGAFVDVTEASGIGDPRRTVGAAWFDADQDGDLDLFVANQNGDEDGFFANQGDGTFVDVAPSLGMHQPGRAETQGSVGTALADYDSDGDVDIFVASYGPDLVWENQHPDFGFVMRSAGTGLEGDHHSVGAAWGDFDHDGRVDLYVGMFLSSVPEEPDYLYRNLGDGLFETVTPTVMLERGASHGVSWADFDRDGDLDLALANNDPGEGTHHLYRNELDPGAAARSLQVALLDGEGRWTRAGSEVRLFDSESGRLIGTRIVGTGGGYSSHSAKPVHFGLPEGVSRVDVEATFLIAAQRIVVRVDQVDPNPYLGDYLEIRR